jgi:hypothetical protein
MKKIFTLIVSLIALAGVASAQTYSYSFTGTSSAGGYPASFIDGSTLTISGGLITTYDFMAPGFGNFGTPATTTIVSQSVTGYGPNGWTGFLDLDYQTIDIEVTGNSFTSADLQASIQGNWAVPDVANTFALLGAVVVGLAACRPVLRRAN